MSKNMNQWVYLFVFACIAFLASVSSAQECPAGEVRDCNGYCAPMAWLFDDICDEEAREHPEGSGYYVDFSCEPFMCDLFACDGCGGDCPAGFAPDCAGNCIPATYIADGICDIGQRNYKGVPIDFSCQQFACDGGDCASGDLCWGDQGLGGLDDIGACCLGTECSEMTRGECWTLGYTFIGNNTMCLPETCSCGDPSDGLDWVVDCNGECVLLWNVGGSYCSHGETVDYGDGPFQIDLDCPALACGLSGCVGNCLGGCCTGADCITATYYDCIDIGGLFLGSYEECNETECVWQQKPIQLPDTELYWSGKLGEVENFPQWIISEEDLLIAGAMDNSTFEWKTAICVFRYNETEDEWEEEALLVPPDGKSEGNRASYTTDGHRIAVTSAIPEDPDVPHISRNVIDIFAFDGSQWLYEQRIDDSVADTDNPGSNPWASSLDILGDVLVVGDPMYNIQPNTDTNHGAAHIYHHDAKTGWAYDSILSPWGDPPYPEGDDKYLGLSVALSDSVVAVASDKSILLYDLSGGEGPQPLQHIRETQSTFHAQHRSMDFDNNRLMTHVGDGDDGLSGSAFSEIYELNEFDDWVVTAELRPFDIAEGTDFAGYIVDLEGDRAMITSPWDNDLGHKTGSAYIWEFDQSADGGGGEWIFKSKLWSDRAVGEDQFGIGGALHGSNAYLTGIVDNPYGDGIKVFFPRGIAWINPLGGNLSDSSNWAPIMPTLSDSVSFSLRSQTSITVGDEFPFKKMLIGPGSYAFDLQGANHTLNAGEGEGAIWLDGVHGITAELKIKGGILQVEGETYNGEEDLPGKIALVTNDAGVMGGMNINGLYMQHEAGELLIELQMPFEGQLPAIEITTQAPILNGILSLTLQGGYTPQDGDIIPLLTSEFVDSNTGQFSMILVNSVLPEGLYIKLIYEGGENGESGSILAEVDLLENLFGYGDPSNGSVSGTATDVVLADVGSTVRSADGFDDIVVSTLDSVYVFLSDGTGGIAGQAIYPYAGEGYNSIAAIDAGDLDGNGTIDLVFVNSLTNEFVPMFNEFNDISQLVASDPIGTGPNPTDVLAMNIDNDSDIDVVIACYGYSLTDGQIDFFEAVPAITGGFASGGSLASPGNPGKIDPGDVNNDKDFSIFVSFSSANAIGKANRAAAALGGAWSYSAVANVAIGPSHIVSGDLNGDSIDDVVVSCPESDVICIIRGVGDGTMSLPLLLDVGELPTRVALLDFDNDGDKDIAVISTSPQTGNRAIAMYRNDTSLNGGNFMFANDASFDDGLNPILIAKGDLDGDGHDDLVSVNQIESYLGEPENIRLRKSESQIACPADFDENGEVNVLDLLELIGAWGYTGPTPQDLNGDSTVTVLDLLILIGAWGSCQ
ncbi:MAG: hypothetical protein HOK75_03985 [Phycisphaerae bacterium]|nr:hypothetical protein [Phycisphaerae bacterium]